MDSYTMSFGREIDNKHIFHAFAILSCKRKKENFGYNLKEVESLRLGSINPNRWTCMLVFPPSRFFSLSSLFFQAICLD